MDVTWRARGGRLRGTGASCPTARLATEQGSAAPLGSVSTNRFSAII
jgi:hypothetical protein